MRPNLVEYDKIFKKKSEIIEVTKPPSNIKQVENCYFFLNVIAILIIVGGVILLYYRKKNKEINKRIYTQKVVQFYHDTNKFEK
tara:strand:- start:1880 stop:2131 length:252 start_codon:yes stop_codon:yes gene_type:complete